MIITCLLDYIDMIQAAYHIDLFLYGLNVSLVAVR